jgi:hypothetical protein
VESQIGEQEAVSGDPADGLQHDQRAVDETRSRRRYSQRRQHHAKSLGLSLETANPELAPLVGHDHLSGSHSGCCQSGGLEQTGNQE